MSNEPTGPLTGTTVLDLTRVLSGPYCTMMLADMGARVIKIEPPGRGDDTHGWGPPFENGESSYFMSVNRNKESLTLNVKHSEGRRILETLLDEADVLVENFRPGTLARMQLAYTDVATRRLELVYCSISGFGHTGPRRAGGRGDLRLVSGPATRRTARALRAGTPAPPPRSRSLGRSPR